MTPPDDHPRALRVPRPLPRLKLVGQLTGIPGTVNGGCLTVREREVVALIAAGHTTSEISALLFVSVGTVKRHVEHALTKTLARNRAHLVALALSQDGPFGQLSAVAVAA